MSIAPLEGDGVAIFPGYRAQETTILSIKASAIGGQWNVYLPNDQSLFTINSDNLSMSDRKHVLDASGKEFCQIRRKMSGLTQTYWGQFPGDDEGQKIWTVELKSTWKGLKYVCSFENKCTGSPVVMELRMGLTGMKGDVTMDGVVVATVERLAMHLRTEYKIEVANGLDFMVVIALFVALDERP
jgi:uncharacterized protein YxjI